MRAEEVYITCIKFINCRWNNNYKVINAEYGIRKVTAIQLSSLPTNSSLTSNLAAFATIIISAPSSSPSVDYAPFFTQYVCHHTSTPTKSAEQTVLTLLHTHTHTQHPPSPTITPATTQSQCMKPWTGEVCNITYPPNPNRASYKPPLLHS